MLSKLNKRQWITLLVVLLLLITIPSVIYLVYHPQILEGRAIVDPKLTFIDSSGNQIPGDSPTTPTRNIGIKITHP